MLGRVTRQPPFSGTPRRGARSAECKEIQLCAWRLYRPSTNQRIVTTADLRRPGARARGRRPVQRSNTGGREGVSYRAALPEGAIAGGTYRVSATGGADVGAFETIVEMPPPIDLTTNVPPGTVIPRNGPVLAEWTGAQSGSVVRMKLIVRVGSPYPRAWHMTTVHATDAKLSWGFSETFAPPPGRAEVSVFLEPETFSTFQAEGLTLGGQHVWEYEYRFTDLRVRVQ